VTTAGAKKLRVYEIAKDLKMSSDAVVEMIRALGVQVRGHMSTVDPEVVGLLHEKMAREKEAVKEGIARKHLQAEAKALAAQQAAQAAALAAQEAARAAAAPVIIPASAVPPPPAVAEALAASAGAMAVAPALPPAPAPEALAAASAAPAPVAPAPAPPVERPLAPGYKPQPPREMAAGYTPRPPRPIGPRPRPAPGERPPAPGYKPQPPRPMGPRPMGPRPMGPRPTGPRPSGPRPGAGLPPPLPAPGAAPGRDRGGPPGRRHDKKKKKRQVDERAVLENVRKTIASMEVGRTRRRRRDRDGEGGEASADTAKKILRVTEFLTAAELAAQMGVKPQEVIAACLELGMMVSINRRLDKDLIAAVADEFDYDVEFVSEYGVDVIESEEAEATGEEVPRPPVVTVMGHVDHGKTSLLDHIRRANVVAGEAGGITQHIGAYQVEAQGRKITFLDTPGHEAFTAMRARGAQVTDIVVLVVAADDRVMPQTVEAIDHARAAGVPIVVAANKIDLPAANVELVKQELTRHALVVEDFGGTVPLVPISAKKGLNIEKLLEIILLQADLLELKADPLRKARGVVLEAKVEQGRGIVPTVLVQHGTLKVGMPFVAGQAYGKVRALLNERGQTVREAGPSAPVELLGWDSLPQAGDSFHVVADDREAREIAGKRQQLAREQEHHADKRVTLTDLYEQIKMGAVSDLNIIIKGDVDGSVEALADSLGRLSTSEVRCNVIRQGVGQIAESDVLLAAASNAIIVGFHVRPDPRARELANREKVDIRLYQVIYEAVEEVKSAMSGLLKPEKKETVLGSAEVRRVFELTKAGTIAGCMVLAGTVSRSARVRLIRNQDVIWEGKLASLKRFKDDTRDVQSGFECGIGLEGFDELKEGDLIEAFQIEEVARTLA
jgi:translation initiation factor IF-2